MTKIFKTKINIFVTGCIMCNNNNESKMKGVKVNKMNYYIK